MARSTKRHHLRTCSEMYLHEDLGTIIRGALECSSNWKELLAAQCDEKSKHDCISSLLSLLHNEEDSIAREGIPVSSNYQKVLEDAVDIVFGSPCNLKLQELQCWCNSQFTFSSNLQEFSIGLSQEHSGPCGVLVPLQCWMISFMFLSISYREPSSHLVKSSLPVSPSLSANPPLSYNPSHLQQTSSNSLSLNSTHFSSLHPNVKNHNVLGSTTQYECTSSCTDFNSQNNSHDCLKTSPFIVTHSTRQKALAWAMSICLYRSTVTSLYVLVSFCEPPRFTFVPKTSLEFLLETDIR